MEVNNKAVIAQGLIFLMMVLRGTTENIGCGGKPADVLFVLDASGSIWNPHFKQQLKFVSDLTKAFDIGSDKTRVGVLTFGDNVRMQIDLRRYSDKPSIVRAINDIRQDRGSTATNKALQEARKTLTKHKRVGAAKLIIVLTDGQSNSPKLTATEAELTHKAGLNVFAIGIGKGAKEELSVIASDEQYVFSVNSFSALQSIKEHLAIKACKVKEILVADEATNEVTDKLAKGCGGKPGDMVFVLDSSSSIWSVDFKTQLKFVQDFSRVFDLENGHTQIGVLTYSSIIREDFPLNAHRDEESIVAAIGGIRRLLGSTHTGEALHYMWKKSFSQAHGARKDVPHIAFVITDGKSTNPIKTKHEALKAREKGIRVIAVGVGKYVDLDELHHIAGDDVFTVDNYNALDSIKEMLAFKACKVTPPPTTTTTTTTTPIPTTPPLVCAKTSRADIVYAMSGVRDPADINQVLKMIKSVSSKMEIGKENVRVGIVPTECAAVPALHLKHTTEKDDVLDMLGNMAAAETSAATVVKYMRKSSFSVLNGARTDPTVKRIGVLIVGDDIKDLDAAIKEARKAEALSNIELYVVGVGKDLNHSALKALGTGKASTHVFTTSSFDSLADITKKLLRQFCGH